MEKGNKDRKDLDEIARDMVSGEIWYAALVDVHRWFGEAVKLRDVEKVDEVLDLMERLGLID